VQPTAVPALATAQVQRANTQEPADQIVMDAMQSANLTQVSVGPRSTISHQAKKTGNSCGIGGVGHLAGW